jgi:D-alanyl-lipoteichoic acid acyltransferase DltB (MBOAT superfamily)
MFAVVMIATVSFDGAGGSDWFRAITGPLGDSTLGRTFLLLAVINVVTLAYYTACAVAAFLSGGSWSAAQVAQRFAHTLVPIGLAYAVSHYFTLVIFEGQQLFAAVSDPFGLGWDLFGTADFRVRFFVGTSTPIWLAQVTFIVGGHLVGIVLAHDRALQDFGRDASRSQYAMLVLMIALTSLGLLILSG